jgi:hypothetical protein
MRNSFKPAIRQHLSEIAPRIVPVLLLLNLVAGLFTNLPVKAQSTQNDWTQPVNLSQSGSTSNPQVIIDSAGELHAIWLDKFAGYQYSQSKDGAEWSKPISENFPFGKDMPVLISDSNGFIHALWIDDQGRLFSTRWRQDSFSNPKNWDAVQQLAESALDVSAVIDPGGVMHVAYIRNLFSSAFPAGVYYRLSKDNGVSWFDGVPLYQSLYFRSMTKADAHVQVMVGQDPQQVYVAWDDRFLRRIYLAISANGGKTWGEPAQIDNSSTELGASTLYNIQIIQTKKNLLALWQVGDPGVSCTLYFQQSSDAGVTWSRYSSVMKNFFFHQPQRSGIFPCLEWHTVE